MIQAKESYPRTQIFLRLALSRPWRTWLGRDVFKHKAFQAKLLFFLTPKVLFELGFELKKLEF